MATKRFTKDQIKDYVKRNPPKRPKDWKPAEPHTVSDPKNRRGTVGVEVARWNEELLRF